MSDPRDGKEFRLPVKPVIAVDFDGVLHRYSKGWDDGSIYDPPMPGTKAGMEQLRKHGYTLLIFSARNRNPDREEEMRAWLKEHEIPFDRIATLADGKPFADVYLDDLAVRFEGWTNAIPAVVRAVATHRTQLAKRT